MMLEPNSRCVYLEELRPPVGYRLDRAIATTYSLELLTLLMAPLSIALQECRSREDALGDPIAVLEALRQTTGRLTVFCQQGRIAVPAKDALLYRYLEPLVVEVRPPNNDGVFHAKTWLLRFVGEAGDDPIRYRFLCLSRNLTFDRSWDTLLSLDGTLEDRQRAFSRNRPLSEFFASLPTLAQREVPEGRREDVAWMADEVLRVRFEPPEGFEDEIQFLPLGIPGYKKLPDTGNANRVLIVSPFLSDSTVLQLLDGGDENILVSRPESLDALKAETIEALDDNSSLFYLDDAAERPEEARETDADEVESMTVLSTDRCSGLHAKLYIVENGWYATVFSGSANATSPPLKGLNVELLVGVRGKKSRVGIEAFLGTDKSPVSFRGMLQAYHREEGTGPDSWQRRIEELLGTARRVIGESELSVQVAAADERLWNLTISSGAPVALPSGVKTTCFPISLGTPDAKSFGEGRAAFEGLSLASLTGFIAFVLSAEVEGRRGSIGFVLNVPVEGMPTQRDQHILREVISNPARFIRYLLLILAEEEIIAPPGGDGPGWVNGDPWRSFGSVPVLEEMVRAFSRHPEKIARIQRLVEDLRGSPEGSGVLPAGFEE
ncbi:MAG: phospholipase D family protein, partial [Thermoguttaceae bacterium]